MSDIMQAIPFKTLLTQVLEEYRQKKTVFSVKNIYENSESKSAFDIFSRHLELPLGVAAGPHTQLAQNLAACYAAGARFLELKTIQKLYGEDLAIPRPCIRADDEAYNVEWSSEFCPDDAATEYIKGYFLCKVLAKEFSFGDPDGFIFNMSCGYDYEGLKDPSVDKYIETLKNASSHPTYLECLEVLKLAFEENKFEKIDLDFIENISPEICSSLTLSTMHGCPPDEIEKMAMHILEEKRVNLYVKCNPTLLGYEYVRNILDDMGYDYIKFGREQFEKDLAQEQAFPMFRRLMARAKEIGLIFGVKLTNTFQTEIHNQELPGSAMYMSGKALYPLSLSVANLLANEFDGKLPMSFSGGADQNNLADLLSANICPVTVCTILLKPRGMNNLKKLAEITASAGLPSASRKQNDYGTDRYEEYLAVDKEKIAAMTAVVKENVKYCKSAAMRKKYDLHKPYVGVRSDDYHCRVLCQSCVDVCPNRANDIIDIAGDSKVILHIDRNCNECGNCQFHCVEPCLPYRDRLTLFHSLELFRDSENQGVCFLGDDKYAFRVNEGNETTIEAECEYEALPEVIRGLVDAVKSEREYLL